MQTHWWRSGLIALGVALLASSAAAEGMRCGNRLVSKGDTTYVVRSRCGEPDDATRRVETRTERRRVRVACGPQGTARCDREQEVTIDVVVDEWIYDFGPQSFIRHVIFVDGKLVRVDTGSYGSRR